MSNTMKPFYLYTGGVLKLVARAKPDAKRYHGGVGNMDYTFARKDYGDYLNQLPSIQVSDELKAIWKEGDRPVEYKDFIIESIRTGGDLIDFANPIPSFDTPAEAEEIHAVEGMMDEGKEDQDLWDDAFTNAPVRLHPKTEEYFKSKYTITRK